MQPLVAFVACFRGAGAGRSRAVACSMFADLCRCMRPAVPKCSASFARHAALSAHCRCVFKAFACTRLPSAAVPRRVCCPDCTQLRYDSLRCRNCVVQGYRRAGELAAARLREMGVGLEDGDVKAARTLLEKCARTSLNSKLISRYQARDCAACFAPHRAVTACHVDIEPRRVSL